MSALRRAAAGIFTTSSPHISPIREEMAQDIVFTVHCPRAGNTHCIGKRGECAVDSRDKPGRVESVRYAGWEVLPMKARIEEDPDAG